MSGRRAPLSESARGNSGFQSPQSSQHRRVLCALFEGRDGSDGAPQDACCVQSAEKTGRAEDSLQPLHLITFV